jgi:hypothetical protein
MSTAGMTLRGKVRYWFARATGQEPPCTPSQAKDILAQCIQASIDEDRYFDEWMAGPGVNYPKVMVQCSEFEGAPLLWVEDFAPGWIEAVASYCEARRAGAPAVPAEEKVDAPR